MFDKNINLGIFWGNFFIPYYGLMIVIGLIFATLVALFQIRKYNLDLDNFILLSAISGLFAIIGSKFLFLLVSWKQIQFSKLTNLKYLNFDRMNVYYRNAIQWAKIFLNNQSSSIFSTNSTCVS